MSPDAVQVTHTIELSPKQTRALVGYARREGMSKAAAFRRGVRLLLAISDRLDDGAELVVKYGDGTEKTVLFPW